MLFKTSLKYKMLLPKYMNMLMSIQKTTNDRATCCKGKTGEIKATVTWERPIQLKKT